MNRPGHGFLAGGSGFTRDMNKELATSLVQFVRDSFAYCWCMNPECLTFHSTWTKSLMYNSVIIPFFDSDPVYTGIRPNQ